MEPKRISGLLENSFDGNPWLDITLMGTLENVSAQTAAKKPECGANSIWEIVNHLIDWRENILRRVKGEIIVTPHHNYFQPVVDQSRAAWTSTLVRLSDSQQKWLKQLENMKSESLADVYPPNGHTHYEHVHGIIQHDVYHLGQIVMILKYLV